MRIKTGKVGRYLFCLEEQPTLEVQATIFQPKKEIQTTASSFLAAEEWVAKTASKLDNDEDILTLFD